MSFTKWKYVEFRQLRGSSHLWYKIPHRFYLGTLAKPATEEDFAVARKWLQTLDETKIPKSVGEISYSRSSGPGGQNVNKVNSKAQLRVPLDRLLPLVPPILHQGIRSSRYYANKTESLLIQADDSRKQGTNKDSCYRKLFHMLADVGKQAVPGETSEEQKERVKTLKQNENEGRIKLKKHLSNKKSSRSNSYGD